MPNRLILIRHGESEWNADGILQGQADPPLSERGREQARALVGWARGLKPDGVVTSDLGRARETASILGWPDAKPDARWREVDIGKWAGRPSAEVRAQEGDAFMAWRRGEYVPEGGESYDAMGERAAQAARALLERSGTQVAVCHGGPIRMVCVKLLGLELRQLGGLGNGSATLLGTDGQGRPRLLGYNLLGEGAEDM